MKHFIPTLNIIVSAGNVRSFVKENMDVFWDVFKPLLPYLVGLYLLDMLLVALIGLPVGIGSLFSSYIYAALAITWHRVVLHGPDRYEPMNLFKPKKSELVFMMAGIGIFLILVLIATLILLPFLLANEPAAAMGIFILMAIGSFIWCRLSFYFPAKAVEAGLSFKEAFKLSKGYVLKLVFTPIVSFWRLLLLALLVSIVLGAIVGVLAQIMGLNPFFTNMVVQIPMMVYFQPLMTVYTITVLSNYYQYAQRHKDYTSDDQS